MPPPRCGAGLIFLIKFPHSGKTESGVMIIMGFLRGANGTGPYFEGWYFKHQNPQGQTLALIPAFHVDSKGRIYPIPLEKSRHSPFSSSAPFSACPILTTPYGPECQF